MLTDDEFIELVETIRPPVTARDILLYGDMIKAHDAHTVAAVGYAKRILAYFEKKRNQEDNENGKS